MPPNVPFPAEEEADDGMILAGVKVVLADHEVSLQELAHLANTDRAHAANQVGLLLRKVYRAMRHHQLSR